MAFLPGPQRIIRRMEMGGPKSHLIGPASAAEMAEHYAHATGQQCPRCGRVIEADQIARKVGDGDWVHDMCPAGYANSRAGAQEPREPRRLVQLAATPAEPRRRQWRWQWRRRADR